MYSLWFVRQLWCDNTFLLSAFNYYSDSFEEEKCAAMNTQRVVRLVRLTVVINCTVIPSISCTSLLRRHEKRHVCLCSALFFVIAHLGGHLLISVHWPARPAVVLWVADTWVARSQYSPLPLSNNRGPYGRRRLQDRKPWWEPLPCCNSPSVYRFTALATKPWSWSWSERLPWLSLETVTASVTIHMLLITPYTV